MAACGAVLVDTRVESACCQLLKQKYAFKFPLSRFAFKCLLRLSSFAIRFLLFRFSTFAFAFKVLLLLSSFGFRGLLSISSSDATRRGRSDGAAAASKGRWGLEDIARHFIGNQLKQEMRVQIRLNEGWVWRALPATSWEPFE
jgi:hypothetical protein